MEDIENRLGSDFYELYGLRESFDVWNEKDDSALLQLVAKKHRLEEIAHLLKRPLNVVHFNRAKLAAKYKHEERIDSEDIEELLGMTSEEVAAAIASHPPSTKKTKKEKKKETSVAVPVTEIFPKEPTMAELMAVLVDIQTKLQHILSRIE